VATHLAAPLKAGSPLLLGYDQSNLSTLSAQRATLLKSGSTVEAVDHPRDRRPARRDDGIQLEALQGLDRNFDRCGPDPFDRAVVAGRGFLAGVHQPEGRATAAKNAKIGIITIFYQGSSKTIPMCGSQNVAQVLGVAASNADNGSPSTAPSNCATANSDGDYYFCASDGTQLSKIFSTALQAAQSADTRFVQMPGS